MVCRFVCILTWKAVGVCGPKDVSYPGARDKLQRPAAHPHLTTVRGTCHVIFTMCMESMIFL